MLAGGGDPFFINGRWKIINTNMIRMKKIIYITRDKNINLYGLHLYFSIVKVKFGKKNIF
jgi:hypothetical protein